MGQSFRESVSLSGISANKGRDTIFTGSTYLFQMLNLTNPRQSELLLNSLKASLKTAQDIVDIASKALAKAQAERDEYNFLVEAMSQSLIADSALTEPVPNSQSSVNDTAHSQPGQVNKGGLDIPALLRQRGVFSTTDEVFALVQTSLPDRGIKKKTVQNSLSGHSLNKAIMKVKHGGQYLWGFDDWLDASGMLLQKHLQ
jgi:hypothetical protein